MQDQLPRFIGRQAELATLKRAYQSSESEMVAVIGRHRVGKTSLVGKAYEGLVDFEITGLQHSTTTFSATENQYSQSIIDQVLTMEDLFCIDR